MDKITHIMGISMITNIFLALLKIITGILGSSGALIADGIHSFSDLSTDFVAVIGNFLSKKPADEKHPYGHGKIQYITSMLIGIFILILGFSIIYESSNKEIIIPSFIVAIISVVTVIIKYILSEYIIRKGRKYKNNILLASGYESRTDVISSIVVLISIILMQFSNKIEILKYTDFIATIIVGLLIIKIGFDVLKENISIVLEEQITNDEYLDNIRKIILETNDICFIDCLMIFKYGFYYKLIAEVRVDSDISIREAHQYIHEAEIRIKNFDSAIRYVTIHINPEQKYHLLQAEKKDINKIQEYCLENVCDNVVDYYQRLKKEKEMKKKIRSNFKSYFMILVDNKKVGTVGYYSIDKDTIFIENLFIKEEYRQCKIGTSIIKDIIDTYFDKNIVLWIYKNSLIINFLEHLGFKKIDETATKYKMGIIRS